MPLITPSESAARAAIVGSLHPYLCFESAGELVNQVRAPLADQEVDVATRGESTDFSIALCVAASCDSSRVSEAGQHPVSVWCMFCCRHVTRMLSALDHARYCSSSCARAAEVDRRTRRRIAEGIITPTHVSIGASVAPAHWRVAVGERYMTGSVVSSRPRCGSTGKVGYAAVTEAWVAAFIDFGDTPGLNAYPCDACGDFHLGRTRRPQGHASIRWARKCFDVALGEMLDTVNEMRSRRPTMPAITVDG